MIDVTLAFEYANSKVDDFVAVADFDYEESVGNILVEILRLS